VLPRCRQPSQVSRRCSLSRPRAQRLSRTANRWCGHRCPCDKRVRTSHPSAGTRRAQTEGWSDSRLLPYSAAHIACADGVAPGNPAARA
jgi:hypothetical protein